MVNTTKWFIKTILSSNRNLLLVTIAEFLISVSIYLLVNNGNVLHLNNNDIDKRVVVIPLFCLGFFFIFATPFLMPGYANHESNSIIKVLGLYKKEIVLIDLAYIFVLSLFTVLPSIIFIIILFDNVLPIIALLIVSIFISLLSFYLFRKFMNRDKKRNGKYSKFLFITSSFLPIIWAATSLIYTPVTTANNLHLLNFISILNPVLSINVIYISIIDNSFEYYYIFPLMFYFFMAVFLYSFEMSKQKFLIKKQNKVETIEIKETKINKKLLFAKNSFKINDSIIIGQNGSGKTTILKSIYDNINAKDTSVFFLGNVANINGMENYNAYSLIKRVINYSTHTGKDASGLLSEIEGIKDVDFNKKIKKLSGGQKQLFFALMMVCSNSRYLLIDELETSLDNDNFMVVLSLIIKYNNHSIKVMVTHNDKTLEFFKSFKTLVIKDKKITIVNKIKSIESVI